MINQYAITPDLPGGTRHFDFGCELVKRGYEVYVFASDVNLALRKHMKLQPGELWREEEVEGVRFIWIRASLYEKNDWRRAWNMLSFSLNAMRVARKMRNKPNVVIGSSPHLFAALAASRIARNYGAKFVFEVRDLWPQALVDLGGFSEQSSIVRGLRIIEKRLYDVADKIVVLAPGSRDYLVRRDILADKIAYIPNGVRLAAFQTSEREAEETRLAWRREFGFSGFTIVYTGAHSLANSLDTILLAADILKKRRPDIQFVLVGDGPSKEELVRTAHELSLTNVRFMNPLPKSSIPKLLRASDAAVITLRAADAFSYAISPNKLFDYMAAARPIICAVPGAVADLVTLNGAGLAVESEAPDQLVEAAEAMLNMTSDERNAMGQRGRNLVSSEFSREILTDRLVDIL